MRGELHAMAEMRGIPMGDGSQCAVCGDSPFDSAGHRRRVLGPNFANHDMLSEARQVCLGCVGLMAGKPGSTPKPLRMMSFIGSAGEIRELDRPMMWDVLCDPPNGEHILSWAVSKKIHHWLWAGLSSSREEQAIGSDFGTIYHRVEGHAELRGAVLKLLAGRKGKPAFARSVIESGSYHPTAVARFGVARWQHLDAVVARHRPSHVLSLICWCAPVEDTGPKEEEEMPISNHDQLAVTLVSELAEASRYRRREGKMFWGGVLRHRIERARNLPLQDAISRLLDWLECETMCPSLRGQLQSAAGWDAETSDGVSEALRKRPALVISLAMDAMKLRVEERKSK